MVNSKILLERALQILRLGQVPQTQWAAGGGTILKEYFGHRLSKDIDIFVDDVQYLSALSFRCNDEATEALDYVETGRYISLTFPEGKIDFIASPPLTPFAHKEAVFLGHHILWEHPIEIVAKKMFFRGEYAIPPWKAKGDENSLLTKYQIICYHIQYKIAFWGCNGLDGGSWCIGSEPGGHHPVSKVKLLLNIKANEDYALAA